MANTITEVLNATGMSLPLYVGGMTKFGIGISGTWVGTINFFYSTDGVNFLPLYATPFASGTTVASTTANGNWEGIVANAVAIKVVFTRTSGSAIVKLSASLDSSYQNAFLASTSQFVAQTSSAATANVITQAAQTNRAWRLRSLVTGWSVAPAADVLLTITDGASTLIWETYIPKGSAAYEVPLPRDPQTPGLAGGGVVNTPGNSMVITLASGAGSVVSTLAAEFVPA